MPTVFEPDRDASRDEPPFVWRRARIGRQAGTDEPVRVPIVSTMNAPDTLELRGEPE